MEANTFGYYGELRPIYFPYKNCIYPVSNNRQTSKINRILVGNTIFAHSDIVAASSFST